ncbi:MAG TPA: GNAT family N-acetyltransferase [Opitutales bacterium]|nr:GNAT family N-acetyltransferase [Opitutales bacterium]
MIIRSMERPELDLVLDWAAKEGWNPGLQDADAFWAADPDGFIVAERNGQVVGALSVVSYDARFGFVGLFIVRPDARKQGVGRALWDDGMKTIRSRLQFEASIGLDGVLAMRAAYEKSGFQYHTRHIRFEGVGVRPTTPITGVAPAARVPFASILAVDSAHFPVPRPRFLAPWLRPNGGAAFAATPRGTMGKLGGYAVVRKCRNGFKIGPLFAADEASAESLFLSCSAQAAGQPLFLDVPEGNAPAMALAAKYQMKEVFSCARMYNGPVPAFNQAGVYGVTTFELG